MGIRVCERDVRTPAEPGLPAVIEGWYQPYIYSPEYVMYVKGIPIGEVFPSRDEPDCWVARIYPHMGKEYDTQDEAMLFLEAVQALAS